MEPWLTRTVVGQVIGASLMDDVDDTDSLEVFVEAVAEYVEDRRPDLFPVLTVEQLALLADLPRPVPAQVRVGAALLAYRTYRDRTTPDAELAATTDLAALLGIGKSRGLRFGGASAVAGSLSPEVV